MPDTYTNAEVNAVLTDAAVALDAQVKMAAELDAELQKVRAALATRDAELAQLKSAKNKPADVVLQKVAFDKSKISDAMDTLVERGIVDKTYREKIASELATNTPFALDLLIKVA